MTTRYPQLKAHLEKWGLRVEAVPNWQNNGRPWSASFRPKGILVHHDASSIQSGLWGARSIIINGRTGLPGPLSQFQIARDGTVLLVTGEGANHGGRGGPTKYIREDMSNYDAWGIEAANNGIGEPWPAAQLDAYYTLCAALLDLMGHDEVDRVVGHKEYTSRKIDPAGINMNDFRAKVRAKLDERDAPPDLSKERRYMVLLSKLQPTLENTAVKLVKQRLHNRGFASSEINTRFDMGFSRDFTAFKESLGYANPNGWPDVYSLSKLNLIVGDGDTYYNEPKYAISLAAFAPNQSNASVLLVKRRLYTRGFRSGVVNTIFENTLVENLRGYAAAVNAEGVPETLEKLNLRPVP